MKILLSIIVFVLLLIGSVMLFDGQGEGDTENTEVPLNESTVTKDDTVEIETKTQPDTVLDTDERTSGLEINLSNRGLTRVDMSVFDKTSATKLDISNNNLSGALQAEVRHLQNLEILDMSDNNFTGVPAEVGQLTKLRILDLSNNPITGLPYEIGNLSNLETLDLRGTQYSEQDLGVIQQTLPSSVVIQK